jgi:hypothetical protein
MSKTKAEVMELLDALPDDCLLEHIEYALHVRQTINRRRLRDAVQAPPCRPG